MGEKTGILSILILVALLSVPGGASAFSAEAPLVAQKAFTQAELTGFTKASRRIKIVSEVSGRIKRINLDIGGTGAKQPFVVIETTFIDLQIKRTEASLQKIEASMEMASSNADYRKKEFERVEGLYKNDRATEVRRDSAEEALRQALLNLDSLKAEKRSARASLEELRERRTRHFVTIPKGWTLTERLVEPGEIVQAGQALGEAGNYTELAIELSLSDKELRALKETAKKGNLNIYIEGRKVPAGISWINPKFDPRTRKSAVEIFLVKGFKDARGGLQAKVPVKISAEGLLIPKEAVINRYENPKVITLDDEREVRIIIIEETPLGYRASPAAGLEDLLKPGIKLKPAPGL